MLEYPFLLVLLAGGWLYHVERRRPAAACAAEMTQLRDQDTDMSKRLLITMSNRDMEKQQQLDLLRRALSALADRQGCDHLMPRLEKVLRSLSPAQLQRVHRAILRHEITSDCGMDMWCVTTLHTMVEYVSVQSSPSQTPSSLSQMRKQKEADLKSGTKRKRRELSAAPRTKCFVYSSATSS